jgi:hypothetical protein
VLGFSSLKISLERPIDDLRNTHPLSDHLAVNCIDIPLLAMVRLARGFPRRTLVHLLSFAFPPRRHHSQAAELLSW